MQRTLWGDSLLRYYKGENGGGANICSQLLAGVEETQSMLILRKRDQGERHVVHCWPHWLQLLSDPCRRKKKCFTQYICEFVKLNEDSKFRNSIPRQHVNWIRFAAVIGVSHSNVAVLLLTCLSWNLNGVINPNRLRGILVGAWEIFDGFQQLLNMNVRALQLNIGRYNACIICATRARVHWA